jgi:hypothetical protein
MNTMTIKQIREKGLNALHKALGPVATLRFLQDIDSGTGNYTEDRHQWLDGYDTDSLYEAIVASRKKR